MYANCPIICESRLQTEIALSTIEAEYIALSQAMKELLHFVSLMKNIKFVINLQEDTLVVLCSHFKNPATVNEDNQGAITLAVAPQIWPHTKHTAIKFHHYRIFVADGNIEIKNIDTKEHIEDILRSR